MKRIDWLKQYYTDLLRVFNKERRARLTVDDFLLADPTPNKRYTDWLIKTYLAGGFRAEDLSKATETLSEFIKNQHRLDIKQRDINSFATLGAVWSAVSPFAEVPVEDLSVSGKEQKRRNKAMAYDQSIILVDHDEFKVAIPLTEFASKWWGKGTRWCTAADKDNVFDEYHQNAPLFIFILPNGRKMQMYVTHDDFQFMDENDEPVKQEDIGLFWGYIGPYLNYALSKNLSVFRCMPHWLVNRNDCVDAIVRDGYNLGHIPEELRDLDLCLEAVTNDGMALDFVPKELRTAKLCEVAVQNNGLALKYVPEHLRNEKVCKIATTQNLAAINFVPEEWCDSDLCYKAVKKEGTLLRCVPVRHRTKELCYEAVKQSGFAIQYVPKEYRTVDLYNEAIKKHELVLNLIPYEDRDFELYKKAVEWNGNALKYVPNEHHSPDLYRAAVRQGGLALSFVPPENRTEEICSDAVRQNSHALKYVDKEKITYNMCFEAVSRNGTALMHVPLEMRTADLCRVAVRQHGLALNYVPDDLIDKELCIEAVERHENARRCVPERLLEYFPVQEQSKTTSPFWPDSVEFLGQLKNIFSYHDGVKKNISF